MIYIYSLIIFFVVVILASFLFTKMFKLKEGAVTDDTVVVDVPVTRNYPTGSGVTVVSNASSAPTPADTKAVQQTVAAAAPTPVDINAVQQTVAAAPPDGADSQRMHDIFTTVEDIVYRIRLNNEKYVNASVSRIINKNSDVVNISPSIYKNDANYDVTSIESNVFDSMPNLKTVTIPWTITDISYGNFGGSCPNLEVFLFNHRDSKLPNLDPPSSWNNNTGTFNGKDISKIKIYYVPGNNIDGFTAFKNNLNQSFSPTNFLDINSLVTSSYSITSPAPAPTPSEPSKPPLPKFTYDWGNIKTCNSSLLIDGATMCNTTKTSDIYASDQCKDFRAKNCNLNDKDKYSICSPNLFFDVTNGTPCLSQIDSISPCPGNQYTGREKCLDNKSPYVFSPECQNYKYVYIENCKSSDYAFGNNVTGICDPNLSFTINDNSTDPAKAHLTPCIPTQPSNQKYDWASVATCSAKPLDLSSQCMTFNVPSKNGIDFCKEYRNKKCDSGNVTGVCNPHLMLDASYGVPCMPPKPEIKSDTLKGKITDSWNTPRCQSVLTDPNYSFILDLDLDTQHRFMTSGGLKSYCNNPSTQGLFRNRGFAGNKLTCDEFNSYFNDPIYCPANSDDRICKDLGVIINRWGPGNMACLP